jgi:hypothetical protein
MVLVGETGLRLKSRQWRLARECVAALSSPTWGTQGKLQGKRYRGNYRSLLTFLKCVPCILLEDHHCPQ